MAIQPTLDKATHRPTFESLYSMLEARAAVCPQAVAICAPGRSSLTYERLLIQIDNSVQALRDYGIRREDRVAIVLPNGPEMATAFLSVASGAACAPLNPSLKAQEFDFFLTDLKARALIVGADMDSAVREVARKRDIALIELSSSSRQDAGIFSFLYDGHKFAQDLSFTEPNDTALVLHTSGTTSRPKTVPLTQSNLCASARNIAVTLDLQESDRCLNVMPLFHIHGLMAGLVASLAAGASVACAPAFDADAFFGWMESFSPTWYTAVPTIHQAVLARSPAYKGIISRRPLRFIRSSSAALPQPVLRDLETVFQTQVIEAYGMTEASHQMASNPLAPLPHKSGSVGIAFGTEIGIMDELGRMVPTGEIGEVVVRGPNVMRGYEGNASANHESFANGWFRTGDQGRIDQDGYLFLTGRLKEIINRGGEKIAPREVDEVLSRHPAIEQVVTFAVSHPTLGEDVAAAVVFKKGARAGENEIRDFAVACLADYKVPKQLVVVDEIPKGPTGKLQRIGLAERLATQLAADRQENFAAPATSVEEELADIWKNLLGIDQIGVRDDFHVLGGDSLILASMLIEVNARFHTDVPVDKFLRSPTIETIAAFLMNKDLVLDEGPRLAGSPDRELADRLLFLRGLRNRLFQLIALYIPGFKTSRVWLHRKRGVSIGENTSIGMSALIETAYPRLVSIGNNVTIGIRTVIIGHLRDSTPHSRVSGEPTVRIEDDVYIGPGVVILPNVIIGKGAVVSAGSVVSRSVPPHTFVRGNPATPVARCGVSLGGGISYEQFLRHLTPIDEPFLRADRRATASRSESQKDQGANEPTKVVCP
jgi:acyl-CoA synthetase (AMP-forming)/AMP-acid ligase II/acetyltransferase-like isoleucine patch superfamily enzyme